MLRELEALSNQELYAAIIKHREIYIKLSWVDYTTLERGMISFLPPPEIIELFKSDYETMREQMIYGEAPNFTALIERLKILLERFRNHLP